MDRTVHTNTRDSSSPENPDLKAAERKVERDIERFNSAIDNLADKVDETSNRVQSTVHMARNPGETLKQASLRFRHAAMEKMRPIYNDYRARTIHLASRARARVLENRGPIVMVCLGFLCAWAAAEIVAQRRGRIVIRSRPSRGFGAKPVNERRLVSRAALGGSTLR
jgi:hypothetical protein